MIVGDFEIRNLNGPIELNCLKLKDEYSNVLNSKYIMLLGEEHSYNDYVKCDTSTRDCVETKTDFIHILNEFGKRVPVHFFIEDFNLINPRLNPIIMRQTKKKIEDQMMYMSKIIHKDTKKSPFLNPRSDMTDLEKLYRICFNQIESCKYKNIQWNYVDIRKISHSYDTRPTKHIDLNNDFELYSKLDKSFVNILKNIQNIIIEHPYNDENDEPSIITAINENASNILDMSSLILFYEVLFNDLDNFISYTLLSFTIQKQYKKMSQRLKDIFNKQTFIDLLQYHLTFLNESFSDLNIPDVFAKVNRVIDLLKRINPVRKHYLEKNKKLSKQEIKQLEDETLDLFRNIIEDYKTIEFNERELQYIEYYYISCSQVYLDIYFILRLHKYGETETPELIVSYFGNNHSIAISHYFINIIQSHTLDYNKTMTDIKRISIDKEINLNTIFL